MTGLAPDLPGGGFVTRTRLTGDADSLAVYSPCKRYPYTLTRVWDPAGARVLFVMLNPSTATRFASHALKRLFLSSIHKDKWGLLRSGLFSRVGDKGENRE